MLDPTLRRTLMKILGKSRVRTRPHELSLYAYDASLDRGLPDAVVFPESTDEVEQIVRLAGKSRTPFAPRGSGTNLSGGSVLAAGGIVIELARMDRILSIDAENLRAVVQPGVYNLDLQNALAPVGLFYAPDPASQKVSTLGGNVGENSGGPHGVKYGVTSNHVLALEVVLADGERARLGGATFEQPPLDLVGVFVGSEGTLGIATEITLRVIPLPEDVRTMLAVFDSIRDASSAVARIFAARIVPATLEMMDQPVIRAVEESLACGYPVDAAAVLIIEIDGPKPALEETARTIIRILQQSDVRDVRLAQTADERETLWAGRRGAFGAIARIAPNYLVLDGTVPRTRLPEMLEAVHEIGRRHELLTGNVFHAGDGNLHPLFLFDDRVSGTVERVRRAGMEVLQACVRAGGTISGEHGIGMEKMDAMRLLFSDDDLFAMSLVKKAFDPHAIANPGKVIPAPQETAAS
ncbi:MAG: FAD-linked oxidase C-terminal domain-containing protein [Planctomycetota bacterium]